MVEETNTPDNAWVKFRRLLGGRIVVTFSTVGRDDPKNYAPEEANWGYLGNAPRNLAEIIAAELPHVGLEAPANFAEKFAQGPLFHHRGEDSWSMTIDEVKAWL